MKEALPQVKAGKLPEHLEKALVRGLVETIKLPDFLDALSVHPLPPPVTRSGHGRPLAARVAALQLRHHLLHRPARHELDHHKGDEQDAEQRRDHQQQTFEDVGPHDQRLRPGGGLRFSGLAHQVMSTQLSG